MSTAIKQTSRARASAFRFVLGTGKRPFAKGQQELFKSEEDQFIRMEVERKLYDLQLPNAGDRERKWIKLLWKFANDESLVVNIRIAAKMAAQALQECLPTQEYIRHPRPTPDRKWLTLPGCYYTRKGAVTPKTNGGLYNALLELKAEAKRTKHREKKWLADFLEEGLPVTVSNFKMECLYLLRGADGEVVRLVRLINTKGEMSEGREIGGADILPNEFYAGSEKFRQWAASKGNFVWGGKAGAGNTELQLLQWDVFVDAAYRTVKLIEYTGWHETHKAEGGNGPRGLWFFDGSAIDGVGGKWMLPDGDGIVWHEGIGYAMSSKGRELEFAHGRPVMPVGNDGEMKEFKPDTSKWSEFSRSLTPLGGFFREVCARFFDTAGGAGGWMAVASVLGYAIAPEFFQRYGCQPSIFIPGEMGSGKTFFTNWLMGFQGFLDTKGLGLGKGSFVTVPGLCAQLENYSCLAVWFDEYREHEITPEKIAVIRAAYDRQLANKITGDGVQRVIRTTPLVSGETATGDAATHSRYTQLQLSRQDRLADHLEWLRDNRPDFVRIWAHVLENRPRFIKAVMTAVDGWLTAKDTQNLPERSRATYALAYGTFIALIGMFESHTSEEMDLFRRFMVGRAGVSASDVEHDKYSNVFIQDLLTAYDAGAIPSELFRVVDGPWQSDETGYPWKSYDLYWEPHGVIDALNIHLRKAGRTTTLKYKDLRDQLSRNKKWWIQSEDPKNPIKQRFGSAGSRTSKLAWGLHVDGHPLGRQAATVEEMQAVVDMRAPELGEAITGDIRLKRGMGDPRKGALFSIIEGVLKAEENVK